MTFPAGYSSPGRRNSRGGLSVAVRRPASFVSAADRAAIHAATAALIPAIKSRLERGMYARRKDSLQRRTFAPARA